MKKLEDGTLVFGSLAIDGFIVGESIKELLTDERMWKAGYLLEHMSITGDTVAGNELHWKLASVKPRRFICTDLRFDDVSKNQVKHIMGQKFNMMGSWWMLDIPNKEELDNTVFSNPKPGEVCHLSDLGSDEWRTFIPVIEMLSNPSGIHMGAVTRSEIGQPMVIPTSGVYVLDERIYLDFDHHFADDVKIRWLAVDDCFIADRPLVYTHKSNMGLGTKVNVYGLDYEVQLASCDMCRKAKNLYRYNFGNYEGLESMEHDNMTFFWPVLVPITEKCK